MQTAVYVGPLHNTAKSCDHGGEGQPSELWNQVVGSFWVRWSVVTFAK